MSSCEQIIGLKLDDKSLKTIERIEKKARLGQLLAAAVSGGVLNSIFTKSSAPVAGYNITQTDWTLYAEAMQAIPVITKKAIRQEIDLIILHYNMPGNHDFKLMTFWRNVRNGCSIEE